MVFTLQSIKSRIETLRRVCLCPSPSMFLLYSPLNQGLKLSSRLPMIDYSSVFTLQSIKSRIETRLAIRPLLRVTRVFTLQSIKSRIETSVSPRFSSVCQWFLLYSPLNQGLKLYINHYKYKKSIGFYSTVH